MKFGVIILILVFIAAAFVRTIAQVPDTEADLKTLSARESISKSRKDSLPVKDTQNLKLKQKGEKGQIYIGYDWPVGIIVLRNGGVIDNYCLRYNILTDQLQFAAGKDTLSFANPEELNTATFDSHTFIYEKYQSEDSIRQGYFELIVPGKNKLMLKRSVTKQKSDPKYPPNASPAKYQVDECYFISKPGLPANKLACNRKSVLTVLNDHNEDIEEYLRITGNKVRTIEDLKLLVSYYNSLDEEY